MEPCINVVVFQQIFSAGEKRKGKERRKGRHVHADGGDNGHGESVSFTSVGARRKDGRTDGPLGRPATIAEARGGPWALSLSLSPWAGMVRAGATAHR